MPGAEPGRVALETIAGSRPVRKTSPSTSLPALPEMSPLSMAVRSAPSWVAVNFSQTRFQEMNCSLG